jgi:hypothetical protein
MSLPLSSRFTKTHFSIRQVAWVIAFVSAAGWTSAHADIYTWVDSSGNVNLSNRPPPEGARVTNVFREDPAVRASSEAARAVAQHEELRALSERVAQLEQDLDAASSPPPLPAAPVAYAPPIPAPAAYPSFVAEPVVTPASPTYGNCTDPWASCLSPGNFGFYPSGVVVLSAPAPHGFRPAHRGRAPSPPPAPAFPQPVGALPDPVNLFPGNHRR